MKLNISSAFIISGTPYIAQCPYSIAAKPTRCSFTGVLIWFRHGLLRVIVFLKR